MNVPAVMENGRRIFKGGEDSKADNVRPLSGRGGARATLDHDSSIPPPPSAPAAGCPAVEFRAIGATNVRKNRVTS
jgi:hypothetical protein